MRNPASGETVNLTLISLRHQNTAAFSIIPSFDFIFSVETNVTHRVPLTSSSGGALRLSVGGGGGGAWGIWFKLNNNVTVCLSSKPLSADLRATHPDTTLRWDTSSHFRSGVHKAACTHSYELCMRGTHAGVNGKSHIMVLL